jgi:hypothetical protein
MHGSFPLWRVVFATCFSEPLGVPPWTNFGLPWGILGPILSISCKISGAKLVQNSKIPEQQIAPTTPSTKNKQGFQNNFADNQFK